MKRPKNHNELNRILRLSKRSKRVPSEKGTSSSVSPVQLEYIRTHSRSPSLECNPEIPPAPVSTTCGLEEPAVTGTSKRSQQQKGHYLPRHDELVEDENLAIINETIPDQEDEDPESPSLPIRNLDHFTIYSDTDFSLQEFRKGCLGCVASGFVTAHSEDDEEDILCDVSSGSGKGSASDSSQYVKLGKVKEVWMDMEEYEDPKIWIRTIYAWYILRQPSTEYEECYGDKSTSLAEFLSNLYAIPDPDDVYADAAAYAFSVLGRNITSNDFHSVKDLVAENLSVFRITHRSVRNHWLLLREIFGRMKTGEDDDYPSSDSPTSRQRHRAKGSRQRPLKTSNSNKEALHRQNTTVVTPHVSTIAKELFDRSLNSVGQDVNDVDDDLGCDGKDCVSKTPFVVHHDTPDSMYWGEPFPGQSWHYKSVVVDGVEYRVGNTVAVKAGVDEDEVNAANAVRPSAKSCNTLENEAWFCIIQYFYEEEDEKYFHGRWFEHGAKTVLAETANPQGLFLTNDCDNNLVSSILQKCEATRLRQSEKEPVIIGEGIGSSSFYFSHIWDRETISFIDPDTEDQLLVSRSLPGEHNKCYSCALKCLEEYRSNCFKSKTGLTIFGREYHCYDFVYVIRQNHERDILSIAQIVDLLPGDGTDELEVRFFARYEDHAWVRNDKVTERRALQPTNEVARICANNLDGHCHVESESCIDDLDMWINKDDHFYIRETDKTQKGFHYCAACRSTREEHDRIEQLIKSKHRLNALDLFSGAGGLTTGMDESGFVKTRWAVELSQSAARTINHNHPDIVVYNQDCSLLLQNAIERYEGKDPKPLRSLDGNKLLPAMPLPGEVDIIMGGPPCQGFSGMNMYKKANDIRNTLICNMISYVEHYRPLYLLIENVMGLLYYPLKGESLKDNQRGWRIVGGVEAGIVKFIMRSLTSLGYQVHINVLNAAEYGSPQARKRVIFWGSKLGIPLPKYPIPSHICQSSSGDTTVRRVSSIGRIPVSSRSRDPERRDVHDYAPFWAVTVRDAVHDLPGYDWEDPHQIVPRTEGDREEEAKRLRLYPAFAADMKRGVVGFLGPESYRHGPQHPYQAWCRKGNGHTVNDQHSPCLAIGVVERTVNVPIRPLAGHSDLPPKYRKENRLNGEGFEKGRSTYVRLDSGGQFQTAMTIVRPNAKGSTVLHPTQKRVITIRECARAQGFPDNYEFLSVEKQHANIAEDKYRQIGNAVPVHLALALGKALGETMIAHWREADSEDETVQTDDGSVRSNDRQGSVDV